MKHARGHSLSSPKFRSSNKRITQLNSVQKTTTLQKYVLHSGQMAIQKRSGIKNKFDARITRRRRR